VSFPNVTRAAVIGLAVAVGGVVFAGIASADTDSDSGPESSDSSSATSSDTDSNADSDADSDANSNADSDADKAKGDGGPGAAAGDLTPAGVPIAGLVKSAAGATKVLPGGQGGPGY
jgi:hypothetical protein